MRVRAWIIVCVVLAPLRALAAPTRVDGQKVPPVQAASAVDRTAIWVADRVTYSIDLVCAPNVDVLLDDLSKEKLRVNGLEVVSTDASATTDADGRTAHHLSYVLTTYRVDTPSPSIEPLVVRYYARKPGQRLQDSAPAGEVQVPGAVVAFRSSMPDNQPTYVIRDTRAPAQRPWLFASTHQIGLALVILAVAPAAVAIGAAVRQQTRTKAAHRSKRRVRADYRAAIERLGTLDVATEEERRRAYDEISTAVRQHVAAHSHVPATALTADELDRALASAGGRISRESVTSLLAECDAARYSPPEAIPSAERCRDALSTARQLLKH